MACTSLPLLLLAAAVALLLQASASTAAAPRRGRLLYAAAAKRGAPGIEFAVPLDMVPVRADTCPKAVLDRAMAELPELMAKLEVRCGRYFTQEHQNTLHHCMGLK